MSPCRPTSASVCHEPVQGCAGVVAVPLHRLYPPARRGQPEQAATSRRPGSPLQLGEAGWSQGGGLEKLDQAVHLRVAPLDPRREARQRHHPVQSAHPPGLPQFVEHRLRDIVRRLERAPQGLEWHPPLARVRSMVAPHHVQRARRRPLQCGRRRPSAPLPGGRWSPGARGRSPRREERPATPATPTRIPRSAAAPPVRETGPRARPRPGRRARGRDAGVESDRALGLRRSWRRDCSSGARSGPPRARPAVAPARVAPALGLPGRSAAGQHSCHDLGGPQMQSDPRAGAERTRSGDLERDLHVQRRARGPR